MIRVLTLMTALLIFPQVSWADSFAKRDEARALDSINIRLSSLQVKWLRAHREANASGDSLSRGNAVFFGLKVELENMTRRGELASFWARQRADQIMKLDKDLSKFEKTFFKDAVESLKKGEAMGDHVRNFEQCLEGFMDMRHRDLFHKVKPGSHRRSDGRVPTGTSRPAGRAPAV